MEIYDRYYKAMYNTAYRIVKDPAEAEDVMHESFLCAFSKLHTFKGDVTFGAWLKRIVINNSIYHYKKQQKNRTVDLDDIMYKVEDNDGVAETDSDWKGNDIVLEYSSQDPDIVEMMSPMNHIDKSLTSETMTQIVTKGAYSSLHPLFTKITDCANNKRRAGLLWKCLQHTHQLLLNDLRKDEIKSGALQEGIASDPTNTSGRKRSNARTKRPQDKHRPKKKRKDKP